MRCKIRLRNSITRIIVSCTAKGIKCEDTCVANPKCQVAINIYSPSGLGIAYPHRIHCLVTSEPAVKKLHQNSLFSVFSH